MTTKIIEAYKENEFKFKEISDLSERISLEIGKKTEVFNEIKRIYTILFRNFNTKRIETPVMLENSKQVFINKEGISIKHYKYDINSSYIDGGSTKFIECIKLLKEKKEELLKYIRENKQGLFNGFLENVEKLKPKEEFNKILEKKWVIIEKDEEMIETNNISINTRNIKITPIKDGEEQFKMFVRYNNPDLEDKLIIEQIYDELKEVLGEYLKSEQENLKDANIFLEDIKTKFAKELIINALGKQKRK